jgi:hypothetical protein
MAHRKRVDLDSALIFTGLQCAVDSKEYRMRMFCTGLTQVLVQDALLLPTIWLHNNCLRDHTSHAIRFLGALLVRSLFGRSTEQWVWKWFISLYQNRLFMK